jgi:hypothetical protein
VIAQPELVLDYHSSGRLFLPTGWRHPTVRPTTNRP